MVSCHLCSLRFMRLHGVAGQSRNSNRKGWIVAVRHVLCSRGFVAKAPGLPNAPRSGVDVNIDFQQARAWLRDCYLSHPECQGWRKQRTLPTRLVHVRRVEGSSRIVAKVCPSEKLPATTTYLSLSHCWGDFKFLTTTRSNLAQFELQLPVKSLSRTIQDAMLVTLEMEFEYIWIDSLCIIQDSAEDWAKEASLMGEVYHNASCNISASAVPNGEHGFILPRVFDPTPILAQVNWSTNQVSHNADTVSESHCFIFNNPRREIARGPLFKRAWTLQEQLLASRALHFGTDQMFWECSRTFANEVWPHGWENKKPFDTYLTTLDQIWQFRIEDLPADRVACYVMWYSIVESYSHRSVTFESDWLPALAGLASRFASVLEDTYVHGLWSRDLYRGLLFEQGKASIPGFAPHDSRLAPNWHDIPSWSWAAIHKPVQWSPRGAEDDNNKVCKLEVVHDALGASMLRLSGMLVRLTSYDFWKMYILDGLLPTMGSKNGEEGLEISVNPDEWFLSIFEEEWAHGYDADFTGARNAGLELLRDAVLFVPVRFDVYHTRASVTGLLLCEQPGLAHGQYRRAGITSMSATFERKRDKSLDLGRIMGMLRSYAQPLVDPKVHDALEDGQYVVTVV
ncbi:HET-domain-containing protein [Phaeosphaeriaceae sp. SRC1lsM3a]|nr:HET-domain-containing protein [Stagonospora sp. SRC1lsM3a]